MKPSAPGEARRGDVAQPANAIERPVPRGRLRLPRLCLPAVGLALVLLLMSACGSSPTTGVAQVGSATTTATQGNASSNGAGKYASALAYARCMRSQGLANFPDPKQVGGEVQFSGSGIDTQSSNYRSAQQSCGHLLAGSGQSSQTVQQRVLDRMLHISQCMRAHGMPAFPDPTLSPPSNRADHSAIMSNDGVWLAIPNSIDVR